MRNNVMIRLRRCLNKRVGLLFIVFIVNACDGTGLQILDDAPNQVTNTTDQVTVSTSNLSIGVPAKISGSCSPDGAGNVSISIPGATPATAGPCDCSGGSFSCLPVTFTALPTVINVIATLGTATATTMVSDTNSVSITAPLNLSLSAPANFVGTCSPDGNDTIDIEIPGATPATFGPCDCVSGAYSCGPVTFTSLPDTVTVVANNGSSSASYNPTMTPFVDLVLNGAGTSPGDPLTIAGTCSPDSISSIVFSAAGSLMTPSGNITCNCAGGLIAGCEDASANPVSQISFSSSDTVNTTMITTAGSSTDSDDIQLSNLAQLVFGSQNIDYWEDSRNGLCVRISTNVFECAVGQGSITFDFDTVTPLPAGEEIVGFNFLESTAHFYASDDTVWSAEFGSGNSPTMRGGVQNTPAMVSFGGTNTPGGKPLYTTGDHSSACTLFDNGDLWCAKGSNVPVKQVSGDAKFALGGVSVQCYVDQNDDLICSEAINPDPPYNSSSTIATIASGVSAWLGITASRLSIPINHGFVFNTDGTISFSTNITDSTSSNTVSPAIPPTVISGYTAAGPEKAFMNPIPLRGAFLDDTGRVVEVDMSTGVATPLNILGAGNLDIGGTFDASGSNLSNFVLTASGDILGSSTIAGLETSTNVFGSGLATPPTGFTELKVTSDDICGLVASTTSAGATDIYCSGIRSGGSFTNPVLFGTYTP